jgi:hypothetical protein
VTFGSQGMKDFSTAEAVVAGAAGLFMLKHASHMY